MAQSSADYRGLDAITQKIVDLERSMLSLQWLVKEGCILPTDAVHKARAERLLKELYEQRQAILTDWRAEPDASRS